MADPCPLSPKHSHASKEMVRVRLSDQKLQEPIIICREEKRPTTYVHGSTSNIKYESDIKEKLRLASTILNPFPRLEEQEQTTI